MKSIKIQTLSNASVVIPAETTVTGYKAIIDDTTVVEIYEIGDEQDAPTIDEGDFTDTAGVYSIDGAGAMTAEFENLIEGETYFVAVTLEKNTDGTAPLGALTPDLGGTAGTAWDDPLVHGTTYTQEIICGATQVLTLTTDASGDLEITAISVKQKIVDSISDSGIGVGDFIVAADGDETQVRTVTRVNTDENSFEIESAFSLDDATYDLKKTVVQNETQFVLFGGGAGSINGVAIPQNRIVTIPAGGDAIVVKTATTATVSNLEIK